MKKLLRILAIAVLGVGLSTGVASAGTIEDSGPGSDNTIRVENRKRVRVDNRARLDVTNTNDQFARSGNARVQGNTNGHGADTGDTDNENDTDTEVEVEFNSDVEGMVGGSHSSGSGSIDTSGPRSNNDIRRHNSVEIDVDNDVDVDVENDSIQTAISGSASVRGNTNGRDASTGSASNSNTTSTSVHLSF